ncbi:MAG TPA: hypothetical protein VM925_11870 [Labilithrix sp.]|nr:hypothetical protein [Labilithrix sp.]
MKTPILGGASALLLLVCAACEDSSSSSPSPSPLPSSTGTSPTSPESGCTPPTKGPTFHKGDIASDEVWRADDSPHIIDYNVTIRNGRKLTIEPCAEVELAKGAHLQVAFPGTPNTGSLVAEGTTMRPIHFTGKDGARWSSVMVHAPGTARFAHTTFEGGGGGDFQDGATLVVVGDGVDGVDPLVFLDHVTIARSLGVGAWLQRGASFVPGSRDLTIRESGSSEHPYPIEIGEHALDALPTGNYTGNAKDEILLEPQGGQTAGSGLLADGTMHDRGVPYHVGRSQGSSLIVGGRPDGQLVTLTIEPGVTLRFEPKSAFKVQHTANEKPSTAALKAIGTADKPIVFTSAASSPAPGDWQGLWFGGIPDPSNVIDHVRIENAGSDCGCILSTCSAIAEHEGAIIFTAQPPRAFVTNTTFANIASNAISQGYLGAFVDFRPTNLFEGVAGCVQTRPAMATCPSPRPACD